MKDKSDEWQTMNHLNTNVVSEDERQTLRTMREQREFICRPKNRNVWKTNFSKPSIDDGVSQFEDSSN